MSKQVKEKKVANSEPCADCNNLVPLDWEACPHCGRPGLFPNVRLANHPTEQAKLDARYQAALSDAHTRNCSFQLADFEKACEGSYAVFLCELLRLHAEIASGTDVYKPFRDIEKLRLRNERSTSRDWPALRIQVERELLGNDKHLGNVHYASITINGEGVQSYGEITVTLSEKMIAHRASCVEGNSADLFAKHGNLSKILRSSWEQRARLCVAKLAANVNTATKTDDFHGLVLKNKSKKIKEDFVEVLVFGSMTAATFEAVRIDKAVLARSSRNSVYWDAVKEKLAKHNVQAVEN